MALITFTNPQAIGTAGIPQFPSGAKAITKSDTDTYDRPFSLYVGVAGNVVVTPANDAADVTFTMQAGAMVPCSVKAVKSTNTTASGLVAIY